MDGERTKIEGPEILQEGYPNLALRSYLTPPGLSALWHSHKNAASQTACLQSALNAFSLAGHPTYVISHIVSLARDNGAFKSCSKTSLLVPETMANANLVTSPIAAGFDAARREFLSNFPEEEKEAFSKFTSVDDVYDATDEIQKQQAKTRTLQNLGKIQPYIECLNQYSGVVETIVQIKPDFLAIIWVFTVSWCL